MARRLRRWAFNVLVALDQLANTLAGGDPDETVSSRTAKAARAGHRWGHWGCRALDWFDPGHCDAAIEPDEGHRAVVPNPPEPPA